MHVLSSSKVIGPEHAEMAFKKARVLMKSAANLPYHGFHAHTMNEVLSSALKIAEMEGMGKYEISVLAIMHDVGFAFRYNDNESCGADILSCMMDGWGFKESTIEECGQAVLDTHPFRKPSSDIAAALKDADLSYLGSPFRYFWRRINDLREESRMHPESPLYANSLNPYDWVKSSIAFMEGHEWHTKSARALYEENKKKNLGRLYAACERYEKTGQFSDVLCRRYLNRRAIRDCALHAWRII